MHSLPIPKGPIGEMSYSHRATNFSLWAPTAEYVRLSIFPTGEGGLADAVYGMDRGDCGCWRLTVPGDLLGKFYTFQVMVNGMWLDETPGLFCKAVGVNGQRAAIINMRKTNPDGWDEDKSPELKDFSDVVIYEMHYRDFTMDSQSGILNKGKFLALTEHGTKTADGYSTGIDHLKELGITHVHLLPSFDFGSIDEKKPEGVYNWGYDPVNYNVPEGSYATDAYNPITRIREFKQMVLSLHKAGIRVVLDVVYNHVYDAAKSQFNRIASDYFFRKNDDGSLSNGSGCGNETASEMPMMRKFMIESVLYWIREYHIDGFRFDLMGIHDVDTMNAIRQAVDSIDSSILIYGEGWATSTPKLSNGRLAMKANVKNMPGIAAFGDELRDAIRGEWADDKIGAFLIGNSGHEESVMFGIVGAISHPQIDYSCVNYSKTPWANEPTQMISYVSCHDDMCLADRIQVTLSAKCAKAKNRAKFACSANFVDSVNSAEQLRLQKLAETIVLTSQGIPLLWCGDEIFRNKKGVRNSYNSSDFVNAIPWANKSKYNDLFRYILHLINIRREHKAFHMGSSELVRKNLEFLPSPKNVIAFKLNGAAVGDTWSTIIVAFNSKTTSANVHVPLDSYTVICQNGQIDANGLFNFIGKSLSIPAQSAVIMHN